MSLKATALKTNESQKRALQKDVNSILASVDDELKSAHDQGKNIAIITLPITFSIPYMKNADAQRIIYYKIVKSLIDREFTVEIELQKDITVFSVSWMTKDELQEIDLQNNLLAGCTKKKSAENLNSELK